MANRTDSCLSLRVEVMSVFCMDDDDLANIFEHPDQLDGWDLMPEYIYKNWHGLSEEAKLAIILIESEICELDSLLSEARYDN